MAQLERVDLHGEIELRFPDNTTEDITPLAVRTFLHELVDSALLAASDSLRLSQWLTLEQARVQLALSPPALQAGQLYALGGPWNGAASSTVYVPALSNRAFHVQGVLFAGGVYALVTVDVAAGTAVAVAAYQPIPQDYWGPNDPPKALATVNEALNYLHERPVASTPAKNTAPTVTLASPQAGQTLAVGELVVLNASPADADGAADVKRVEFLDNGVKFTETTASPHTVQRSLATSGGHSFTARVYDMVGASGLSNAVSVTATSPVSTNAEVVIWVFGDSTTAGFPDFANTYPQRLAESLAGNARITVVNHGHSGNTTVQLADYIPQLISSKPVGGLALCLYMGSINDALQNVAGGASAAVARVLQQHKDLHASGVETIACTILPSAHPECEQFIADFNAGLKAGWQAAGCYALVDTNAIPQFNPVTTDFYEAEIPPLHPNQAGRLVVAECVRPTVASWLTGKGVSVPAYTTRGASSSAAPAAPSVTFESGARTFTVTHPLGVNGLEYKLDAGAYAAYTGPVSVDGAAHTLSAREKAVGAVGMADAPASSTVPAVKREAVVFTDLVGFAANGNALTASAASGTAHNKRFVGGSFNALDFYCGAGTSALMGVNSAPSASDSYQDINLGVYVNAGQIRFQGVATGWGASVAFDPAAKIRIAWRTDPADATRSVVVITSGSVELFNQSVVFDATVPRGFDLWNSSVDTVVSNVYLESTAFTTV